MKMLVIHSVGACNQSCVSENFCVPLGQSGPVHKCGTAKIAQTIDKQRETGESDKTQTTRFSIAPGDTKLYTAKIGLQCCGRLLKPRLHKNHKKCSMKPPRYQAPPRVWGMRVLYQFRV